MNNHIISPHKQKKLTYAYDSMQILAIFVNENM